MAVLRVLFRAELRHRWQSWLLLALLIALVSGLVLAGVVAARRTATAFSRYEAAHGYDAFFYSPTPTPTIGSLPDVASSTLVQLPGGGTPTCAGCRPIDEEEFAVFDVSATDLPHMVKLVAGRMPNPSNPHEVLASYNLQRDDHVHLGSLVRVPFAAASQRNAALADATIVPKGPVVDFRVVGIEVAENEFPSTSASSYDLYTTPAFAREYGNQLLSFDADFVRLRHGAADLPRFQAQARGLGGLSVVDLDTAAASIASSIHPQAVGWWILAGLTALVGIIVVAQALARQASVEADTFATLSALGVSRPQLTALGLLRAVVIGAVGVVLGLIVAALLSPLTPVGEARLADPTAGFTLDLPVLVLGGLLALAVIVALGLVPAVRTARASQSPEGSRPVRPSRIVALMAGTGASPSALIGVRHALERGRGRNSVPVGSALVGAILAVTALSATVVFGASLTHLTTTPSLYGQPFDLWFGVNNTGDLQQADHLVNTLVHQKAITGITAGISGDVSINGVTVNALGGQPLRGPLLLTTVRGHLPDAADEVSLGPTTMRKVGASLGSRVRVSVPLPGGATHTGTYLVVGTTSFPPDFGAGGLGTGAVFSFAGLGAHCPPGSTRQACATRTVFDEGGAFLVRATPAPEGRAALAGMTKEFSGEVNHPLTPTNLVNFGEAVNFPLILGLVLIVFGVATLLHVLVVSVTRRRREVGLLKALGFLRRQVAFTLSWQTSTVAVVGIVIGVPAGIAIGRLVWQFFAGALGVVPVPVVTVGIIAAVAVGTLVVANLLAVGPALVAARARPAGLLRTE